jgi:hypothetical protein
MNFTNDSKETMILSRLLPPHMDLKIEDPSGNPVPPIDQYDLAHDELGKAPDPARFEIIPPGASTSREFTVSFFVAKASAKTDHAAPPQGMYEISATLSTWPFWNGNRAKHFQRLWRPNGVLIIEPVRINKLKVNISEPRKTDTQE